MIGCGGKGAANLAGVRGQNIVALCDADERMAGGARDKYPQARFYRDFRTMLDGQKDIDAVVVSTPDHTHAVASVMAMKLVQLGLSGAAMFGPDGAVIQPADALQQVTVNQPD